MRITKAKASRVARWAKLDWEPVTDPRAARGKRHQHHGLLNLLVAAFACGDRTLRQVEEFGEDLSARARRAMGLRKAASDTALYKLLEAHEPSGFAAVLERQVKEGLRSKAIRNDLFSEGVIAIDGKASWVGKHAARHAQRCRHDDGSPYWMLFAQRAVLVSSSAAPCVFQQFIADKTNELASFEACFRELHARFGKSFEVVTSDAGACSRHNARVVHEAGKAYLFTLKENQPNLLLAARARLGTHTDQSDAHRRGDARTTERYRGHDVTRELFRVSVDESDPEIVIPGARQLWRVRQRSERRNSAGHLVSTSVEDRYFVTNRHLAPDRCLRLVRLHWRIENAANWTLDMVVGEDDAAPCAQGHGIAVVSWLRQLAYNLISLWRSKLDGSHGEAMGWRRACELLERAFLVADLGADKEAPATLA